MMIIGDLLRANARRIPDREALVCGGERIIWGDLDRSVNRLANALLNAGIKSGDRVAFIMSNSIDIVRVYYAVAKIGAISVPILPRSVAREITHIVNDVKAACLIASADQSAAVRDALPALGDVRLVIGAGDDHGLEQDLAGLAADASDQDPPVEVEPTSLYAIQYTSGTTGLPKGCMLRHDRKVLSRMSMLTLVNYTEHDRGLIFMPLTASLGADMLHSHVLAGATTILMPRFDAVEMLQLVEAEKISILYAMESTYDRLMEAETFDTTDWSGLRYMFGTGAGHNIGLCAERFATVPSFQAKLWNSYGCTEGGGWLTFVGDEEVRAALDGSGSPAALNTIGRECLMAQVDCLDQDGGTVPSGEAGEMVLSSPWLFAGYWGMPDKTAEALRGNRYFTGDIARKDADGYIRLEGRLKDMIKTGGINVYPAEIEMVMKAHPSIREVAVVGVPDPEWGERVVACVIPERCYNSEAVQTYCKSELAGFKNPKSIVFFEDFPRDVVGKILKKKLREMVMADGAKR